jgi:hypothetical protein
MEYKINLFSPCPVSPLAWAIALTKKDQREEERSSESWVTPCLPAVRDITGDIDKLTFFFTHGALLRR